MIRLPKYFTGLAAVALVALFAAPLLANNVVARVKSVSPDQKQVVVTDQNGKDWTFQVGQNVRIRANNRDSRLADLRQGQEVNIVYDAQNNGLVASAIELRQQGQQAAQQVQPGQQGQQQTAQKAPQGQQGQQKAEHQARGKIENVAADRQQFTLRDQKGRDLTFRVGRNARVQVNGKDSKLADLQQGQEVTVTYRQVLTDIQAGKNDAPANADQQKGQAVRGQIQRVEAAQQQIAVRDQSGKEHTFQVGQNARVQLNGQNASLADLRQGQELTATRQMVANDIRTGTQNQDQNQNR